MTPSPPVFTLRLATYEDAEALEALARRDGRWVPRAPLMVALSGGHFVAAMSITSGRWIANPYMVSEPAVDQLRERVAQITGRAVPRRGVLRAPAILQGLLTATPRGGA